MNLDGKGGARHSTKSRARSFLGTRRRAHSEVRVVWQMDCRTAVRSQSPSRDAGFGGYRGREKGTQRVILPALLLPQYQDEQQAEHLGDPCIINWVTSFGDLDRMNGEGDRDQPNRRK